MLMKCRYIDEVSGGRGITFASGTPVSNSIPELYTIQRYLQYDELERKGYIHFDSWSAQYGETVSSTELSPDGSGYRQKTRFARFNNLPELMLMYRQCADVISADMLHLPVPNLKTGKRVDVSVKPSYEQTMAVKSLGERADDVRAGKVPPTEDNMLRITTDGRKLALDQRLFDPELPDNPESKVNICVENILRVYEEGAENRAAQLVFSDLSTPKITPPKDDGGISIAGDDDFPFTDVYNDLRNKLIQRGILAREIAFIHEANTDAAKAELFARVRSGDVRVLIGSTNKMGAGTNVQRRLLAIHHLDVPWRPSDLEQREGRILRRGNEYGEVYIFRYVTEGTFDAYSYQLVEHKQRFISQINSNKPIGRSVEDADDSALSYAEIKALAAGDLRIKEKMVRP